MRRDRTLGWSTVLRMLVASDLICTASALTLSYWLRFHLSWIAGLEPRAPTFAVWMMLPYSAALLLAFTLVGLYRRETLLCGLNEYGRGLEATAATVTLAIVLAYLTTFPYLSRGIVLLSLGLVAFCVCLGR